MYSATTSSVTFPLLQQKYPRAHRCRPQNSFRNGANSRSILYAVFPFSRCTSRLIVTCGGIDTSRCTWSLLTCPLMISTSDAPQISRIRSRTRDPTAPDQDRLAILRHPDQVQVDLEHAMGPMPILNVVVAAISLTITSWLTSGRPRQFFVMWENSRCSILFHLLVPGGKWQTVIARPDLVGQPLQLHLPQPAAASRCCRRRRP